MASRMDKYSDTTYQKRVEKNRDIYDKLYQEETYSNIEGIVEMPKKNEINIEKLKETIKKREEAISDKKQLVRKVTYKEEVKSNDDDVDENPLTGKAYDIRDILNKAKEEKGYDEVDRYRSLKIEEYAILKKIKENNEKVENLDTTKELEEIVNTIRGDNALLNKLADADLSLDIFNDLKGDEEDLDDKAGENKELLHEIIKKAKEEAEYDSDDDEEDEDELDNSFYTKSLNISKDDFEDEEDNESVVRVKKKKIKVIPIILLIIFILAILSVVGYFAYIKFIK